MIKSIASTALAAVILFSSSNALAEIKIVKKGQLEQTPDQSAERSKPVRQRFLFAVGISDYKDTTIQNLSSSHRDAVNMTLALKEHGNLDGVFLLVEQLATRANIERAFDQLREASKPGDEIIIYWSGHGGQVADINGDEQDVMDEFLVPYDADSANINTTGILDDDFSQWIDTLQDRRVALIIDANHAAGMLDQAILGSQQIQQQQSIEQQQIQQNKASSPAVCALFAAKETEAAHESPDAKGSVMTHLLVQVLSEYPTLTLEEAFQYLDFSVPKFLGKHLPGVSQTPVMTQSQEVFYLIPGSRKQGTK